MSNSDLVSIQEELNSQRRQALKYMLGCMAAAAWAPELAAEFLEQAHEGHSPGKKAASARKHRPLATGKPTYFKSAEYKILTRMVDLILPRTDTPGAADAGVPLYIDLVAGADPALGQRLRKGLADLDAASRTAAGKRFADTGEAAQTKILEAMVPKRAAGNDFFETVKAMTLVGYYSSEIGLYEELHFVGNQVLNTFKGCPHGGHSLDAPSRPALRAAIQDSTQPWPFPGSDNILGEDQ
jgi:hypothetical protein